MLSRIRQYTGGSPQVAARWDRRNGIGSGRASPKERREGVAAPPPRSGFSGLLFVALRAFGGTFTLLRVAPLAGLVGKFLAEAPFDLARLFLMADLAVIQRTRSANSKMHIANN